MALLIDVSVGDTLSIDDGKVQVTILDKKGSRSRLSIEADKEINIEKVQNFSVEGKRNIACKGLTRK